MLVIIAAVIGAAMGARAAQKREGNRLDMAQYAAGYGIAFALVGWFATLLVSVII